MKRTELLTPGDYSSVPKGLVRLPGKYFWPSMKLVLITILDRLGENDSAWPSITTLSLDTGLSRQTVCDALTLAKGFGFIEVQEGKSNRYQIVKSFDYSDELLVKSFDHLKSFLTSQAPRPALVKSFDQLVKSFDQEWSSRLTRTNEKNHLTKPPHLTDETESRHDHQPDEIDENSSGAIPSTSTTQEASAASKHADTPRASAGAASSMPADIKDLIKEREAHWRKRGYRPTQTRLRQAAAIAKQRGVALGTGAAAFARLLEPTQQRTAAGERTAPYWRVLLDTEAAAGVQGCKAAAEAAEDFLAVWKGAGLNHACPVRELAPLLETALKRDPDFMTRVPDLLVAILQTQFLLDAQRTWFRPTWLFKSNRQRPDQLNFQCVLDGDYKRYEKGGSVDAATAGYKGDEKLYF